MRQIYTYKVIRYFPHVLSDEFINVGVVVTSEKDVQRILGIDEAKMLHCSALIGERKKFLGIIEHLEELVAKGLLQEGEHYFHNFRFTEEKKVASDKEAAEIANELFDDYVGFKLHTEAKKEQKEIILETSIRLVEKSFKKYVRLRKSKEFDLELESIKAGILHHANAGRSSLKHDASVMIMAAPTEKQKTDRYDFLDISGNIDLTNRWVQKLEHNYVDVYPYANEDEIAAYMEMLAKSA